ncbi:MAG: ABC transporter ATP-binding protein [Sterolibacterium sp.]|nr:ABC transporter ATP-binding protein [Sterolibacterium sp.]MBP9800371.1 ABC transporter ATP-binding protein [Sterolibacterium sp.]
MLEVRQLEVHYGGIAAVKGVDLTVAAGETVALIGANGAGKSSTLKAIVHLLDPASTHVRGSIHLDGVDITAWPTYHLPALGLSLVPEGRGIFARLTVAENLAMGAFQRVGKQAIATDLDHYYHLLPRLAERRNQLAGTLSGGEQQMLALARALMGRPRLLLLDEPSMGLAPLMVDKIFELIRTVAASGVSILLVEQNARRALKTAQRAYVMDSGRITLSGPAKALLADPRVRAAYLGE